MKESEAMKKWCPFARVHSGTLNYVTAANRNLLDRDASKANCLASRCMAWNPVTELDPTAGGYCRLIQGARP
jgi:hypothetical protein